MKPQFRGTSAKAFEALKKKLLAEGKLPMVLNGYYGWDGNMGGFMETKESSSKVVQQDPEMAKALNIRRIFDND